MISNKNLFLDVFRSKGYTKQDAEIIYKDFVDTVVQVTTQFGGLRLPGLGTFDVVKRDARTVIHPTTKEKVVCEARMYPKFTPSSNFKKIVRDGFSKSYLQVL
nr:MAG TPA: DNA binding protein [Caudoviricetes sp.]